MRPDLLNGFVGEVRIRLKPVLEEFGFSYIGEIDEPFCDKSCLFQSSAIQLIVAVVSDYLSSIRVLLKKIERRPFLRRRIRKLDLVDLAEAMGCELPRGNPVKGPDDLKGEVGRLQEWVRRNGYSLASVDVDLWRRGEEAGKIRLRRWEDFSKDSKNAPLYHKKRQEAKVAMERGDLAAFVKAYASIEKWLGLAEREELERARRMIVEP